MELSFPDSAESKGAAMTQQAIAVPITREFQRKRRLAVLSAWAGFMMDSYSIYITTTSLLPALAYFQGEHMSASSQSILASSSARGTT